MKCSRPRIIISHTPLGRLWKLQKRDLLGVPEGNTARVDPFNLVLLHGSSTRELVKLPHGKKTLGCKWVFTMKNRANGTMVHYKARSVAKASFKHLEFMSRYNCSSCQDQFYSSAILTSNQLRLAISSILHKECFSSQGS